MRGSDMRGSTVIDGVPIILDCLHGGSYKRRLPPRIKMLFADH